LARLQDLGQVVELAPGEHLFRAEEPSGDMQVIIRGDINLYKQGQDLPVVWLGPGDILGEIGFILRTPRTTTARAGSQGCIIWRLDRRVIHNNMDDERMELLTRFFIGTAPYIRVRFNKIQEPFPALGDLKENHCDHQHPVIQHIAESLIGMDAWETAYNISEFIRFIPYRIGSSNVKASRTLQLGYGMCTTKTNLQVALMRACELEAAFGEIEFPSEYLKPIIPEGYHHIMVLEQKLKHIFAVVKIGENWYPCDATYPPQVWKVLDKEREQTGFELGSPFNPFCEMMGRPVDDFKRYDDLRHVMGKRPFYDADNVEAMNIILDKVQGPFLMIPEWVVPIHYLMQHSIKAAYQRAYAGIVTELEQLYSMLSSPPARPADFLTTEPKSAVL
jgi:CRP-like cAMP-binding protein